MKDRLKELRKKLGLTQKKFAEKLGISRNNIASYETGKSNPGSSIIQLICRVYNVNETWLRTGEGEMFTAADSNLIDNLVKKYDLDQLEAAIVTEYINLGTESRKIFRAYLDGVVQRMKMITEDQKTGDGQSSAPPGDSDKQ